MAVSTALVTGANRGLGRATALSLAAAGHDVILTYRTHADEAADVVAAIESVGRRAVALQLDTSEVGTFAAFTQEVNVALAAWGEDALDILVNNAGHAASTPLGRTVEADVDGLFAVHVKGVYFMIQALAPTLRDGGSVITLSSGLSRFTAPGLSMYGAMKGAIDVLTRFLAAELGGRGIRVNAVAPGPIATDFGEGLMRDNEQARTMMASRAALGAIGSADQIGDLIAAVASPAARWVTGQRIEASGGTLL